MSALQSRHIDASRIVKVQRVKNSNALCLHLLELQRQKLSADQLDVLDAVVIKICPRVQTPLVLTVTTNRLRDWPSHARLDPGFASSSSTSFQALDLTHGADIVRATLSSITLAKHGVSETELSEILSLDDDALASVHE